MNKKTKKVIRVSLLVLALVNIVLQAIGYSPIDLDNEAIEAVITNGAVIVTALWNTWKNCSVTAPHLEADKLAEYIKAGASVVVEYQAGGEGEPVDEAEHETYDPEDAEV